MQIENIEALNSDGGKYIYKGIMNAHWRDLSIELKWGENTVEKLYLLKIIYIDKFKQIPLSLILRESS